MRSGGASGEAAPQPRDVGNERAYEGGDRHHGQNRRFEQQQDTRDQPQGERGMGRRRIDAARIQRATVIVPPSVGTPQRDVGS